METRFKKVVLSLAVPLLCLAVFSTANAQKSPHEDRCETATFGVIGYALHRANGKPKSVFIEDFNRQRLTPVQRKYFDFALDFAYAPKNKLASSNYEEAAALGSKFKPLCMANRSLAK